MPSMAEVASIKITELILVIVWIVPRSDEPKVVRAAKVPTFRAKCGGMAVGAKGLGLAKMSKMARGLLNPITPDRLKIRAILNDLS